MVNTVLVGMDESLLGRAALKQAISMFPDAEIVVAHVAFLEFDMLPTDTDEKIEATLDDLADVGDETAQSVFASIRDIVADESVRVSFLTGDPSERLVEYIEDGAFDHVVLGTHGRSGVARVLIGSVAEAVVRETSVPTTLVSSTDGID